MLPPHATGRMEFFDPNASNRDVTLPTAATGMTFVILNFGDNVEILTVKDAAAATVQVLLNGQWIRVVYDGTAWQELGSSGLA